MPSKPRRKFESFPKDRWQQRITNELKFLIAFLNFSFDNRPTVWRELRQYDNRLCNFIISSFREETFPEWKPGAVRSIERLKSEIINDITPLIGAVGAKKDSFPNLEMFCDKLNGLLKFEWYAEPFSPKVPIKRVVPYHGLLQFGAVTWSVSHGSFVRSERHRFYGIIAMALESGEFTKVRFCKYCRKIFLADHAGREFCSDLCSQEYFGKDLNVRKSASRSKKEVELAKLGIPELVRVSSMTLAQIRDLFDEKFEDFIPVAARIKKGIEPTEVWSTLPRWMKKQLAYRTS